MPNNPPIDLTDIVLLLANFVGVDNILNLSNNERLRFTPPSKDQDSSAAWLGDLPEEPKPPILCVKFGTNNISEGWVGGSSDYADAVDIQLATDNSVGVSKRHFRIDVDPRSYNPRVTVMSRSLTLTAGDETVHLAHNEKYQIVAPVIFDLVGTVFIAWRPNLTPAQVRVYRKKALKFSKQAIAAIPRYFPPLMSGPQTDIINVRHGPNNRVYVLQGYSGKGASASVLVVLEQMSGKLFAAKEPYYKASDGPGVRKNRWEELKTEYENILRLDHPHIIKVHDLLPAPNDTAPPWIIEDYIPDCLRPENLDEKSTLVLFNHLLSALSHIHSLDLVHRDVKPDNILIKGSNAILGDFGDAQHRVQGNFDTFAGTPIYMAPEFLEESRSYSNKVDMFSSGMILLECISKWNPRSGSEWPGNALNPGQHAKWMRNIILPRIEDAREWVRPLLRGLLRRRPEKRWSALHSIFWLHNHMKANSSPESPRSDIYGSPTEKADTNRETLYTEDTNANTSGARSSRKRTASTALSDRVRSRESSEPPQSPNCEDPPPIQGLRLPWSKPSPARRPPSELSSASTLRAMDVSLPFSAPSTARSVPPGAILTPVPPELPSDKSSSLYSQVNIQAKTTTGQKSHLLDINSHGGASLAGLAPMSPFWAPTPDRDEGEFPLSNEDNEYSLEESDSELFNDWKEVKEEK